MVTIYIVRHGYSIGNEKEILTGNLDCDLAEYGLKQAKLVSNYIVQNLNVDAFYSSDLCRAVNTIKPAAEALGMPIYYEKDFREVNCGEWEGIPFEKLSGEYAQKYQAWYKQTDVVHPEGGETWAQLQKRVLKRLGELAEENDGKRILISTHGGVIKALRCFLSNIDLSKMYELDWVSNASISEITFDQGRYYVNYIGFDDYLGELKTELPKGV